ncbi:ROK family protein [Herbidospora galbida]|uniref:ROK family protein n=1 Tax=Herbidospora galbida TaxID=2575442 RepID=A0A4U3M1I4_9ACTN|nr:ROK family protein [Herbidospora galbida]
MDATMGGVHAPTTSTELRLHNLTRLLRAVHAGGGELTRSQLTRELGLARGTATVLVSELAAAEMVLERPPADRPRGRPTHLVGPHPRGPVALAADLREDSWSITAAALGGASETLECRHHTAGLATDVLAELSGALRRRMAELDGRVVGIGISVPASVRDGRVVDAVHLGWHDVDLVSLLRLDGHPLVRLGNDATLAALAEARRGALRGVGLGLHLHVSLGVGGALVVGGRPLTGARGMAGEFGHLPLAGDPGQACACGSRGCWDLDVGANALIRHLGQDIPVDRRLDHAERLIALAADGDPASGRAVEIIARAFGRGIGALVNAHDPEAVTLSGLGARLYEAAPQTVTAGCEEALMAFRRQSPAVITASHLGAAAPRIGTAEMVFDAFLTAEGLRTWRTHRITSA